MSDDGGLAISVLGELRVERAGAPVALPASRKTRALLGWLVVTARASLRERLVEVLWDRPDDPRGGLRWSLSKLRQAVGAERIVADREHVRFEAAGADVDLYTFRREVRGGVDTLDVAGLEAALGRFRGELLEGSDPVDCWRYREWLDAEREAIRAVRVRLLSSLVDRLEADPARALGPARTRLALEPYSEEAHLAVVAILGALGRRREALAQVDACRQRFEEELRRPPGPALAEARARLFLPVEAPPPPPAPGPAESPDRGPLVGRDPALAALDAALGAAPVLLHGEPGIGKTRILAALRDRLGSRPVLSARAWEAGQDRAYAIWMDAWRAVDTDRLGSALRSELRPVLPGQSLAPVSPERLHAATARALVTLNAVVLLDDLQWIDAASADLLYAVIVDPAAAGVGVVLAARREELRDHPVAHRLVRALRRAGVLREIALAPLERDEVARLVTAIAPGAPIDRVFAASGGNPLFVREVAAAMVRGEDPLSTSAATCIGERLDALSGRARDLLPWAAAAGVAFDVEWLVAATGLAPLDVVAAVEELERHGVVRPSSTGWDLVHDLVRDAALRQAGPPRLASIHRQLARGLDALPDPTDVRAAGVARHADLGDDVERCVRAAARAARHALRNGARVEAIALADRGLRRVAELPPDLRIGLELPLLDVLVHAPVPAERRAAVGAALGALVASARSLGIAVRRAHYLVGVVAWRDAVVPIVCDRVSGEDTDPEEAAFFVADRGRCLAFLEQDMPTAEALLHDAADRYARLGRHPAILPWGLGVVSHFRGEAERASDLFEEARALCQRDGDLWGQWDSGSRRVRLWLEFGRADEARSHFAALPDLAAALPEGSERPFVAVLGALLGEGALEPALDGLRASDANALVAWALGICAERDLAAGAIGRARERALEAIRRARVVNQASHEAFASAVLARCALAEGDLETARTGLAAHDPSGVSAFAAAALIEAASEAGGSFRR